MYRGGDLQYSFVETIKKRGFLVHIFDYDKNCPCRDIADYFHLISIDEKEKILEIAEQYKPIAITTTACEVGNISACYVAQKLGLHSNSYETALNTTNKARMKEILLKNNIPTAKCVKISNISEIKIDDITYPIVIKPTDRSAGRGVSFVCNKDEFVDKFELAMRESYSKEVLIEEVMQGKQYSIETISCHANHQIVAYTEEYIDDSGNFIETQHMIPARLNEQDLQKLHNLIIKLLNAFDIKYGACHIEVKLTNEGFKVIELASRMGGWRDKLVQLAYNDDYNAMLIDSTLGISPTIKHLGQNYGLVKLMYSQLDYDFYNKIKNETPKIIFGDSVKPFTCKNANNLAQANGYYYISIPRNEDINYYINGTISNKNINKNL